MKCRQLVDLACCAIAEIQGLDCHRGENKNLLFYMYFLIFQFLIIILDFIKFTYTCTSSIINMHEIICETFNIPTFFLSL